MVGSNMFYYSASTADLSYKPSCRREHMRDCTETRVHMCKFTLKVRAHMVMNSSKVMIYYRAVIDDLLQSS